MKIQNIILMSILAISISDKQINANLGSAIISTGVAGIIAVSQIDKYAIYLSNPKPEGDHLESLIIKYPLALTAKLIIAVVAGRYTYKNI